MAFNTTDKKKVIAVVGATGSQGGGLARAILRQGDKSEFAVRVITRNVTSEKSQELARQGAVVAYGDINDEESLTKAIDGAYGMYCVTLSGYDDYSPELEISQATNMSRAARNTGIKHVIWSTMEDTRLQIPLDSRALPTLNDKYKVPHFDSKGESDKCFADLPTTYLLPSFYWENFIEMQMGPTKYHNQYYLSLPIGCKRLAGIASEDIGKCALGVFERPGDYINQRVGIAGELLTLREIAEKMEKALGIKIIPCAMSSSQYRKLGFDGADDFANMFQYLHDFEEDICSARNVDATRKLNPELMTFDQWLSVNKSRIPLNL